MNHFRGPLFALLAAFLFGLSPPLAKLLIGQIDPHLLAGLLYLGSGTAAASASLLLNLEGVFTALIAWFAFREGANRRVVTGFALILCGGIAIGWTRGAGLQLSYKK